MVIYSCERCGYTTNHRSVFKKHLNRKNPCKNYLSNVDIATIKGKYNFSNKKKLYKKSKKIQNSLQIYSKTLQKSSKFLFFGKFLYNFSLQIYSKTLQIYSKTLRN